MGTECTLPADLLPVPAALITFRTADGRVQVVPATWTAVVGTSPATLTVALGAAWSSVAPEAGATFTVHLPEGDLLGSPSLLRALSRHRVPSDVTGAACPVQIECRGGALQAGYGRTLLRGEVTAVSMEGVRYRLSSPAALFQLRPFAHARRRPELDRGGRPGRECR